MKTIADCKFEVTSDLEVVIWHDTQDETKEAPFISQPHYPDGTPFENKTAASKWATDWIKETAEDRKVIPSE